MENYYKTIDLLNSSVEDAMELDIQIYSDEQKYSNWFLAFITGGLALLIGRFNALLEGSWLPEIVALPLLILVGLILLLALKFGVKHFSTTNALLSNLRLQITQTKYHKCLLFSLPEKSIDFLSLKNKIKEVGYLEEDKRQLHQELLDEVEFLDKRLKICIKLQRSLAIWGYALLIIVAIGTVG